MLTKRLRSYHACRACADDDVVHIQYSVMSKDKKRNAEFTEITLKTQKKFKQNFCGFCVLSVFFLCFLRYSFRGFLLRLKQQLATLDQVLIKAPAALWSSP